MTDKYLTAVEEEIVHDQIKEETQLPAKEATDDEPSPVVRRPSRPVSIVHPVKNRIVEATFKQVQDKTLGEYTLALIDADADPEVDIVKTAIVTPGSVIATPCSTVVEYYDPHAESQDTILGSIRAPTVKGERGGQTGA